MNSSIKILTRLRLLCAVLSGAAAIYSASAVGQTSLADQPLSQPKVPNNMLLTLSVEYPTAIAVAYPSTTAYTNDTTNPYLGYFDPAKCYLYKTNDATNGLYFVPNSMATVSTSSGTSYYSCPQTSSTPLWSGNWLNWVSMSTLDVFRSTLTGGYRNVDTTSMTVLEKSWASNQGSGGSPTGNGDAPDKITSGSDVTNSTPFNWSNLSSRVWNLGNKIWITSGSTYSTNKPQTPATSPNNIYSASSATAYTNQNSKANTDSTTTVYELQVRVQPCVASVGLESNCTQYTPTSTTTTYKPEGLMQQYSMDLRFGAIGYLNNSGDYLDGGVLRASMKYVGPMQPNPLSTATTNPLAEYSATDGTFPTNPSPADATGSAALSSGTISQSGVINYLNKFGEYSQSYKSSDPVSELYYAGIRYYENLGNVTSYMTPLDGSGNATSLTAAVADGFPVVKTWTDPILYACQVNNILGIGDVNTHADANIPGTTLAGTYNGSNQDVFDRSAYLPTDSVTNASTSTNMVGTLEGLTLGWVTNEDFATYYIAGLAYQAHTSDMRPNDFQTADNMSGTSKIFTQTLNTYWLDVQEYQAYVNSNQFYLATKYGGFTIPVGFQPYATTNAKNTLTIGSNVTTPMTSAMWTTSGLTLGASAQKKPDNYYSALDARNMVTGLQQAFSKSASGTNGSGTAFSSPSPNIISGSYSYKSTYAPSPLWTGEVIGSTVAYDANGDATNTQVWTASSLLTGTSGGTTAANWTSESSIRKIVTCCTTSTTAGALGVPFEAANLINYSSSPSLSTRTYDSTGKAPWGFANVPNVTTQSATNFLNYLRGDRTNEIGIGSADTYRSRSLLLGDIVNAKLVPTGPPIAAYAESYNPGYTTFSTKKSTDTPKGYADRKTVVYAGANDGMLHAFDGTTGAELFAYIPSFLYGCSNTTTCTNTSTPTLANPVISGYNGLASLGNSAYAHHYMVDSTPIVMDADLNNTGGVVNTAASGYTPKWASVLVGGLGKGGHGYYALDVTDPSSWSTETAIASKVLWEFPSATDTTTIARMGDSYGQAQIVKTAQYGWVAIIPSGYNNTDGKGYLFIVNVANGNLLQTVTVAPTGVSATNQIGLAFPNAFINDKTIWTADAVYAGDLLGNLWRLDLTPTSGSYASPTLMAQLTDPSGNPQPVTTHAYPEGQPNTLFRYVEIGTGKLLSNNDSSTTQIQTFYSIADGQTGSGKFYVSATLPSGVSFPITRSVLGPVTDTLTGVAADHTKPMGWYMDLTAGQRVNVDPTTTSGVAAFAANTPSGTVCSPTGSNVSYALTFTSGISQLADSTGAQIASTVAGTGVVTSLQFQNINGVVYLDVGNSTGARVNIKLTTNGNGYLHRVNWREVPTAD